MKRKIIQIAKSTVMVSLPSKWAKKYNLTKGEEIEIKESGSKLIIETKKSEAQRHISLDATNLEERTLRHILSALHKSGYTEIEIKYKSKNQLEIINDILKNLYTGFAVMEQKQNKVILRKISRDIEEEFNPSLRRAFLVTISFSEAVLECIKTNQLQSILELINLEKTNNQLTNFCERLLNEGIYDYTKTTFLYTILWNLEKIADEYKYICETLSNGNTKLSKEILLLIEEVNKLLKEYYNLFCNFEAEKLNYLEKSRREIGNRYIEISKNKNTIEQKVLHHIISIASKCSDFNTNIVGLNIKEEHL